MGSPLTAILGTVVAVAVISAVTILGWHGTLGGQTIAALFGTLIGGGGAATITKVALNGSTVVAK